MAYMHKVGFNYYFTKLHKADNISRGELKSVGSLLLPMQTHYEYQGILFIKSKYVLPPDIVGVLKLRGMV